MDTHVRRHGRHSLRLLGALGGALAMVLSAGATASAAPSPTAQARSDLVTVKVLPGHWTTSPYGNSGGGGGSSGPGLPRQCRKLGSGFDANPPTVESPYFDKANSSTELQEEIDIYPNAGQAQKAARVTGSTAAAHCIAAVFNQMRGSLAQSIGKGATVGTIAASVEPAPHLGQAASTLRITIPITYQGVSLNLLTTLVNFSQGRFEAVLDESNLGGPVPAAIRNAFEGAASHKL